MNEDKIRQIECEKYLERLEGESTDLQSRVYELEELAGSLVVYLQEAIDIAARKQVVNTIGELMFDITKDTNAMNTLRSICSGAYYKQLMETLK